MKQPLHHLIDVYISDLIARRSGKGTQMVDDLGHPLGLLHDHRQVVRAELRQLLMQQLFRAMHTGFRQRLVQLMRHSSSQRA